MPRIRKILYICSKVSECGYDLPNVSCDHSIPHEKELRCFGSSCTWFTKTGEADCVPVEEKVEKGTKGGIQNAKN